MLQEWSSCHPLPRLMVFEVDGKEYLLEGCRLCRVIQGYDSPETSSSYKIFCAGIAPNAMCKGSNGTILISYELENVYKIYYCEKHEIAVLLHIDRKTLTGVALAAGKIVWEKTEEELGVTVPNSVRNVLTILDGRVCIFSLWNLLVLDLEHGTIYYRISYSKSITRYLKEFGILRPTTMALSKDLPFNMVCSIKCRSTITKYCL